RRRPPSIARRRNTCTAAGAVPHARMLSSDGSDRIVRHDGKGNHRRAQVRARLRASWPGHRPRRAGLHGAQEARRLFLMTRPAPDRTAASPDARSLLRFLTCGSVDDGKSTLIGRLLLDAQVLLDDQLAALSGDAAGSEPDLALILDGLKAEREQGITIDVA